MLVFQGLTKMSVIFFNHSLNVLRKRQLVICIRHAVDDMTKHCRIIEHGLWYYAFDLFTSLMGHKMQQEVPGCVDILLTLATGRSQQTGSMSCQFDKTV